MPAQPIRMITPPDFGGIAARRGFTYQDHVAVHFCIEMLTMSELKEVWCETYDDIVLVRESDSGEIIEFVQVKADVLDQLWSIAKLCERTRTVTHSTGVGTSLLEKSLDRDKCAEITMFRIVTLRGLRSELEILTLDRTHPDRKTSAESIRILCDAIGKRLGTITSSNGHDHEYWVASTQWECHDEAALAANSKVRLMRLVESFGFPVSSAVVESLYEELLSMVKLAAEQNWANKELKMIKKEWLIDKIKQILKPYPNLKHEEKLRKKLSDGGLDSTYIESAKELRRQYNNEVRQPKFLELEGREYFDNEVLARLLELRSKLDSGLINDNGVVFHHLCLTALNELKNNRPSHIQEPPEGFLQGSMYEITSRCWHRFVRAFI